MTASYIGRLAPSPTGLLHLGHAATFWTAFEQARRHGGTLLLRNEDLDPERSRSEYAGAMIQDLAWLGIAWTPPMLSQSGCLAAYRAAFERLLATGLVYRCTCSRRELAQDLARCLEAPHEDLSGESQSTNPTSEASAEPAQDVEPIYSGRCRPRQPTPIARFTPGNYRFRVPAGEAIQFTDGNLGPQSFTALDAPNPQVSASDAFGDFLIWRRPLTNSPAHETALQPALSETRGPSRMGLDSETCEGIAGLPSYQLACAVDDDFQRITEVVRGADLLKSTARQILLQRALGFATPAYFHTQLLRDEHGVRLAKRHDALALRTLRAQGLTPAGVLARIAAAQASIAPV